MKIYVLILLMFNIIALTQAMEKTTYNPKATATLIQKIKKVAADIAGKKGYHEIVDLLSKPRKIL